MGTENSVGGAEQLSVTPPELVAAASAIKNLLTNLSSGFKSLDNDVDTLLDNWEGRRANRFEGG